MDEFKIGDKTYYVKVCPEQFVDEIYYMSGTIIDITKQGITLEMDISVEDQIIDKYFLGKTRLEALRKTKELLQELMYKEITHVNGQTL